jgi:hypothetical protein
MPKTQTVDLTEDRLFPLGWGLIFRAVCAPKSWSPDKVAIECTRMDPPGTSANEWVISDCREREGVFNGVNHVDCPDVCDRIHWLLNC